MPAESLDADYFERLYCANDDPWSFRTSSYEAEKYARTIALLENAHYRSAFEIGCSVGVLTHLLAERADSLLSVDINERALAQARKRCRDRVNVRFERLVVPLEFPRGPFDLVVLSEVGYYWSDDDLALARERIAEVAAGGTLELVHFLPKVEEYVRDGDAVHEAFLTDARFSGRRAYRAERYRIDVLDVA
jgi:SAM-dependent methyltransferase